MLSVTGANFTPDNGSVVYTDFTVLMQTCTQGPVLSALSLEVPHAWQWGSELLASVLFELAGFHPGKSLCECFSLGTNSLPSSQRNR